MANLGKINVFLTAQSNAFSAEIKKAEHSLHGLVERAGEAGEGLKSKFAGLGSIFTGGGEGLMSGIEGLSGGLTSLGGSAATALAGLGPVGLAVGALVGVAAIGAGAVIGLGFALKAIVAPQMEMIDQTFKTSRALGVSTASLMAFRNMAKNEAGVGAEEFDQALRKMTATLGTAVTEGGTAAQVLQRLGVDAGELSSQRPDEAFARLADRIKDLKNPYEQARAAQELFGKQGARLLPMFREGAAGIEEYKKKAQELGVALSDFDAAKVVGAHKAFEELGDRIEGMKNQLTVALAPAIQAIGEKILDLLPTGQQMQDFFMNAIGFIARGIGYLINAWNMYKATVLQMTAWVMQGMKAIGDVLNWLVQKLLGLASHIPGASKLIDIKGLKQAFQDGNDMFASMTKSMQDQANEAWNSPDAVKKAQDWIDDAARKSAENAKKLVGNGMDGIASEMHAKIDKIIADLQESLDFQKFLSGSKGASLIADGLSSDALKKIHDAMKAGATGDELDRIIEQSKELSKLEGFNKAAESLRKLREEHDLLKSGMDEKLAEYQDPGQRAEAAKLMAENDALKQAAEAHKKLAEAMAELKAKQDLMNSGLPDYLANLKKLGATQDQLDFAKAVHDQEALFNDAKKRIEDAKTPLEKYKEEMDKIKKEWEQGFLTDAQRKAAEDKAQRDLNKKEGDNRKVGAEEASVAYRVPAQDVQDPMQKVVDQGNKQLDYSSKTERFQQDLLKSIQGNSLGLFSVDA